MSENSMIPTHLGDAFLERPDYLLAFILSTPAERPETDSFAKEVIARIRRLFQVGDAPRIFATEGTIFSAMLLHHLISERDPEFADSLIARARRFSDDAAYRHAYAAARPYSELETHLFSLVREVRDPDTAVFFRELDTSPKDLEAAQLKTDDALTFLENAGLVVDPAFTPELVLLAGLSPMQFSVRTPKGERIYQEIKIDEPMWWLNIYRGSTRDRPFTEVEFRFRGIEIVRKAIVAMATQYIESEEKLRRSEGRPCLKWKG
jgi:hypothetical protein